MITRKTKTFGFLSLLLFFVALVGLVSIWVYVHSKGEELMLQAKEVANFQAREQIYRELESLVESTQANREELKEYVLTEDEAIDFLATMEAVAVEQGVDLTTNSLKVTEETGLFDTLKISYSVEGLRHRVDTMLLIFETLPYHAYVSNVSMRYDEDSGIDTAQGAIELVISLVRYDR